MSSDTAFAINAIYRLVQEMPDLDDLQRVRSYAAMKTLISELTERNREDLKNGYVSEKLASLGFHCAALAKLNNGNGHPDDQHRAWARRDLDALASELGFDTGPKTFR